MNSVSELLEDDENSNLPVGIKTNATAAMQPSESKQSKPSEDKNGISPRSVKKTSESGSSENKKKVHHY